MRTCRQAFLTSCCLRVCSNRSIPSRVCVNASLRRLMLIWVPRQALCLALLTSTPTMSKLGCCTYALRGWVFRPYSVSLMGPTSFYDSYPGNYSLSPDYSPTREIDQRRPLWRLDDPQ